MIINSLQEFYSFFQDTKPLIAIDYGHKKLGIAISSPDHIIAMPYSIITLEKEDEKLQKIVEIILNKEVCAIVLGLPIYMDGTYSNQTNRVINFAKKLSIKTNMPIYLQDERLTSRAANNLLKEIGLNRKKRNERDDLASASLILETVLESVKKLTC